MLINDDPTYCVTCCPIGSDVLFFVLCEGKICSIICCILSVLQIEKTNDKILNALFFLSD